MKQLLAVAVMMMCDGAYLLGDSNWSPAAMDGHARHAPPPRQRRSRLRRNTAMMRKIILTLLYMCSC